MAECNQVDSGCVETQVVNGHRIEYRRIQDVQQVTIDGEPIPFFRTGADYNLELDAYSSPQPTLISAAEEYAKQLPAG